MASVMREGRDRCPDVAHHRASRAAWGVVWLIGVIWAFQGEYHLAGFIIGCVLTSVALLVASSNICIPQMILIY